MLPADRVIPILQEHIERRGMTHAANDMGISERRLYTLLRQEEISEVLVDRLLTRMDRNDLWYSELADLMA